MKVKDIIKDLLANYDLEREMVVIMVENKDFSSSSEEAITPYVWKTASDLLMENKWHQIMPIILEEMQQHIYEVENYIEERGA
jgi:hypothetical protein